MLELLLLEGFYFAEGGFLEVEAGLLGRLAYLLYMNSEGVSISHVYIVFLEYIIIFCKVLTRFILSAAFSQSQMCLFNMLIDILTDRR